MPFFQKPIPIFNTTKKLYEADDKGLIRSLEMVALPGFPFKELGHEGPFTKITSDLYPSKEPLYVLKSMVVTGRPRRKRSPSTTKIQERLFSLVGTPYVWGGNYHKGFPDLDNPFAGVDCTGLLYEVTEGATPRNSTWLFSSGQIVKEPDLRPLDIIVWPGHIVIALDETRAIESHHERGGVIVRDLKERLNEIKEEKRDFRLRRLLF